MPAPLTLGSAAPGQPHVALPRDAAVWMVQGPQGGYHLWLSLYAPDARVTPADSAMLLSHTLNVNGEVVAQGRAYVPLDGVDGTALAASGMRAFLFTSARPDGWDNQPVDVQAALLRENGDTVAQVSTRWLLRCCADLPIGG